MNDTDSLASAPMLTQRLDQKTAVITGAGSGIGRAIDARSALLIVRRLLLLGRLRLRLGLGLGDGLGGGVAAGWPDRCRSD